MQFGVHLPTLTGWDRVDEDRKGGYRLRYDRSYELCGMMEELGFDFVAIGQHRFTPRGVDPSAPLPILAALGARTERLKLCTNIVILPTHDPIELAEQAATVDELTGGRLILGVGLGYRAYEYEQIGVDYNERTSRLEEGIEVLRRLWSDGPATFQGKHFVVRGGEISPKPFHPGGPPIWIGAQAEPAIMRAARIGDGWLADYMSPASAHAPMVRRYREEAARHGRPATVMMNRKVAIGPTREDAEARWLPGLLKFFRTAAGIGAIFADQGFKERLLSGAPLGLGDIPIDQFIAGTPKDCIASLKEIQRLTAAEGIVLEFGDGAHGERYRDVKAAIELFGREVLPAFRSGE